MKEGPFHLMLKKPISKAEISVQTPTHKPVAYMTIAGDRFRIWVSPTCVRD